MPMTHIDPREENKPSVRSRFAPPETPSCHNTAKCCQRCFRFSTARKAWGGQRLEMLVLQSRKLSSGFSEGHGGDRRRIFFQMCFFGCKCDRGHGPHGSYTWFLRNLHLGRQTFLVFQVLRNSRNRYLTMFHLEVYDKITYLAQPIWSSQKICTNSALLRYNAIHTQSERNRISFPF